MQNCQVLVCVQACGTWESLKFWFIKSLLPEQKIIWIAKVWEVERAVPTIALGSKSRYSINDEAKLDILVQWIIDR